VREKKEGDKMRQGIICAVVSMMVVGLVSCGGGGNANSITGTDQETASIVGTWTLTINSCTEIYTFQADNSFTINSNQEIQKGTYFFQKTVTLGERHQATFTFISDNQLPDCSGSTSNSSGTTGTSYITFTSNQSTFTMYFDKTNSVPSLGPFVKQ